MYFIYDNITASVVAATTALLLLTIQSRATKYNVARVSRNVMEEQAQTFATWLEKDLERMGENMDQEEEVPFENPKTQDLEGGTVLTNQFTFYRDSTASDNDEIRVATRYDVEKIGTREIDGDTKDLYKLTRRQKVGGSGWSGERGTSPSALGYFRIDLLDRDADPVSSPASNPDQVHSIRVRFSVVAPFQNQETFPQATHVGSVLLVRERTENKGEDKEIRVPETWTDCIPWGGSGGYKVLTHPDGTPFDNVDDCFRVAGDHPRTRGGWGPGGGGGFWR